MAPMHSGPARARPAVPLGGGPGSPGVPRGARAANLARVLALLREEPRSRAHLAQVAQLSKSATSSIVGDLMARGLVTEGRVRHDGQVGRPGLDIELCANTLATLGVEVNAEEVIAVALDLRGSTRLQLHRSHGPLPPGRHVPRAEVVLDTLVGVIRDAIDQLGDAGLHVPSVVVAAPGVIVRDSGVVTLSANLGWTKVDALGPVRAALAPAVPRLRLENDTRVSTAAEYAPFAAEGVRDLVYLTGGDGVACGIIAEGVPVNGFAGFAGEIGHLPLGDPNVACGCGRRGCWEKSVGLPAFLALAEAAGLPGCGATVPVAHRLDALLRQLDAGDRAAQAVLDVLGERLYRGISLLVDLLNPEVIVIGGYFSRISDHLKPVVETHLRRVDIRGPEGRPRLAASRLTLPSAAMGGAVRALDELFADPGNVPVLDSTAWRTSRPPRVPASPAAPGRAR